MSTISIIWSKKGIIIVSYKDIKFDIPEFDEQDFNYVMSFGSAKIKSALVEHIMLLVSLFIGKNVF
jgi:hypothetical protein